MFSLLLTRGDPATDVAVVGTLGTLHVNLDLK
jgi:hypothetical protein